MKCLQFRPAVILSIATLLAGCVVSGTTAVATAYDVEVPADVVYVEPSYPMPEVGFYWRYNPGYGWGWYNPSYGRWHRGWTNRATIVRVPSNYNRPVFVKPGYSYGKGQYTQRPSAPVIAPVPRTNVPPVQRAPVAPPVRVAPPVQAPVTRPAPSYTVPNRGQQAPKEQVKRPYPRDTSRDVGHDRPRPNNGY